MIGSRGDGGVGADAQSFAIWVRLPNWDIQLTRASVSPALEVSVESEGAGVIGPCGDGGVGPCHRSRSLTNTVVSPALEVSIGFEDAGMRVSCGDGGPFHTHISFINYPVVVVVFSVAELRPVLNIVVARMVAEIFRFDR